MLKKTLKLGTVLILLGAGYDAGKHWFLKNQLEKKLESQEIHVTVEKIQLNFLPFKSSIVLVNTTSSSLFSVGYIKLRQSFFEWKKITLEGEDVKYKDFFKAESIQGKLHIHPSIFKLNKKNNITIEAKEMAFINTDLFIKNFNISAPEINIPWEYDVKSKKIKIGLKASDLTLNKGESISLNGAGEFVIQNHFPEGQMNLNFKGIAHLSAELRKAKIINDWQSQFLTFGASLLNGGDDEVSFPLSIQGKIVSLGPIPLFELH